MTAIAAREDMAIITTFDSIIDRLSFLEDRQKSYVSILRTMQERDMSKYGWLDSALYDWPRPFTNIKVGYWDACERSCPEHVPGVHWAMALSIESIFHTNFEELAWASGQTDGCLAEHGLQRGQIPDRKVHPIDLGIRKFSNRYLNRNLLETYVESMPNRDVVSSQRLIIRDNDTHVYIRVKHARYVDWYVKEAIDIYKRLAEAFHVPYEAATTPYPPALHTYPVRPEATKLIYANCRDLGPKYFTQLVSRAERKTKGEQGVDMFPDIKDYARRHNLTTSIFNREDFTGDPHIVDYDSSF